jgi:uncharacterized protein (TIGR02118 family)
MIKVVALIRRNPNLSPQEFRDYWQNVHVPLVKRCLPGLTKYTGSFPANVPGIVAPGMDADVDLIVELGFPDRETMNANMNGPQFLSEERARSSATLMDLHNTRAVVMEEINAL